MATLKPGWTLWRFHQIAIGLHRPALRTLLSFVDATDASKADYQEAIQTADCLGKRSGKTRILTCRHLARLYAL